MRISRLKHLINEVPPGFIFDAAWLKTRGIDSKSIHHYVNQGWIERIVRGVYRRPLPNYIQSGELSWQIVLLSCQRLMTRKVHLGGINALDYATNSNSIRPRTCQAVHFYGDAPKWIYRLPTTDRIMIHKSSLFGESSVGVIEDGLLAYNKNYVVQIWHWPVRVSSCERAILEMIAQLSGYSDFEIINRQFQSLKFLCPELLTQLLKDCVSIKVKRLFCAYADMYKFSWKNDLDMTQIDLGRGPRALVPGGRFHPNYEISLPDFFFDDSQ